MDEDHLQQPTDVNGVNKLAGEWYHIVYHNVYGLRTASLRLTNTYGPRQLIKHNRQGFIGWFIRLAVAGEEIQLYGDGHQLRDLTYVDDVVDAFLRAGADDAANGRSSTCGAAPHHPAGPCAAALSPSPAAARSAWSRSRSARRSTSATSTPATSASAPNWAGRPSPRSRRDLNAPCAIIKSTGAITLDGAPPAMAIPFNDLRAAFSHQGEIDAAVQRVLAGGWYILGQEVAAFEAEFAAYGEVAGCVGVNSGTDALHLALRACDVGPGAEVITVAHTAVATVAAIRMAGATPVLVDIDPRPTRWRPRPWPPPSRPTRVISRTHLRPSGRYGRHPRRDAAGLRPHRGLRPSPRCAL